MLDLLKENLRSQVAGKSPEECEKIFAVGLARGKALRATLFLIAGVALGASLNDNAPLDSKAQAESASVSDDSELLRAKEAEIRMLRAQMDQLRLSNGMVDSGLESCVCEETETEVAQKCNRVPDLPYATISSLER